MRSVHPQPEYDGDLWRYKGRVYTLPDLEWELEQIARPGEEPVCLQDSGWYWMPSVKETRNDACKATDKETDPGNDGRESDSEKEPGS